MAHFGVPARLIAWRYLPLLTIMKSILITGTLFLAACAYDKASNDVRTLPAEHKDLTTPKAQTTKDDLIGEWGIYASSDDSSVTVCNMCPTVTFYENGSAIVNYSAHPIGEEFKWKRENQTLTIENRNNTGTFGDGKYTLTFDNGELEMRELGTRYSHTLRKHEEN